MFPCLQDGEKVSSGKDERRCSTTTKRLGTSRNSVIESTSSLYSNEDRRNSSRCNALPPLLDEQHFTIHMEENAAKKKNTVVRIASPSAVTSTEDNTTATTATDQDSKMDEVHENYCCGRTWPISWFHFYLCFGMLGFIVFWLVLMLRIYLPESYWTWSYIW